MSQLSGQPILLFPHLPFLTFIISYLFFHLLYLVLNFYSHTFALYSNFSSKLSRYSTLPFRPFPAFFPQFTSFLVSPSPFYHPPYPFLPFNPSQTILASFPSILVIPNVFFPFSAVIPLSSFHSVSWCRNAPHTPSSFLSLANGSDFSGRSTVIFLSLFSLPSCLLIYILPFSTRRGC